MPHIFIPVRALTSNLNWSDPNHAHSFKTRTGKAFWFLNTGWECWLLQVDALQVKRIFLIPFWQDLANQVLFTAKPSSSHVHGSFGVTLFTFPCSIFSIRAEPVHKCIETILFTLYINQNCTIGFNLKDWITIPELDKPVYGILTYTALCFIDTYYV